jgi:DNA-binding NarL/FixJ family response regulator
VILADDAAVIRQGVARMLKDAGVTVLAQAGDAQTLLREVERHRPDVAVVDIRMPPDFTDEGLRAAQQIRRAHPAVGVLVLSQYVDVAYARKLLAGDGHHLGYLLKDRILDLETFTTALRRVAAGETVVDRGLVAELVAASRRTDPLAELTQREREVLALMAEGRTDLGIARALFLSQKTVEAHVRSIFRKLDIPATRIDNRRVQAVLAHLDGQALPGRASR